LAKKSLQSTGEERERKLKEQLMHLDREIAPSPELISLVDSQGFASVKGQGPGELDENGQQQQLQQQYVSLLRPHPEQRQGRAPKGT
jgi:hypothetical protein